MDPRRLVQILFAALGLAVALALLLLQPGWSPLQLLGFALLAGAVHVLDGPVTAGLVLALALSLQGMDAHGQTAFTRVLLPLCATAAAGALLAGVVVRRPGLGKRIEHGPFGPGGI